MQIGAGQGSAGPKGSNSISGQVQSDQFRNELPRMDPLSPVEALKRFATKPGYNLELVACEPNVVDPVAIAFNEYSQMYVVEMVDYSEQANDKLGVVKLLTDQDADGYYENCTVFASGLSWPTAIACYDQGVFVGAAPDILYLKDTDGDGAADLRKQVFSGFGRKNVQGLLNSFRWGLDNRLYGQTSVSGGIIFSSVNPDVANVELSGKDFSFDPRLLDFRIECGGGQHGMSMDDYGNRFTCHNSDNIQAFLYEHRYELTKQMIPLPPSRRSIAVDGAQANVYRTSPVEPWRILRTNLRVSGVTPGLLEGGGRPSGYFTSATGITIYNGNQMPELYGQAFIADVGSNLVHRKQLSRDIIGWKGDRIDIESEFVTSSDTWFRPVQFSNAPDGCLYILDFYREVIEHPQSLPQAIKQHLDLTSGRDKGRIYRLRDNHEPISHRHDLSNYSLEQLSETLFHPNGWHRETARRLLAEKLSADWQSPQSYECLKQIETLAEKYAQTHSEQGRAGGLNGLGLLVHAKKTPNNPNLWLRSASPNVRTAAIRMLEPLAINDARLRGHLYELADDPDAGVRFQLALTLSQIPIAAEELATRELAVKKLMECMIAEQAYRASVANLLEPFAASFVKNHLRDLASTGRVGESPIESIAATTFNDDAWITLGYSYASVAGLSEMKNLDRAWGLAIKAHGSAAEDHQSHNSLTRILEGILEQFATNLVSNADRFQELPEMKKSVNQLVVNSMELLKNENASLNEQINALKQIRWSGEKAAIQTYLSVLNPHSALELQTEAIELLEIYSEPTVADEILSRYLGFTPALKTRAIDLLMRRSTWRTRLLEQLELGTVKWNDFSIAHRTSLLNNPDQSIRQRVEDFAQSRASERSAVIAQYQSALSLTGDIQTGKSHFAKLCASCHKIDGHGYELGPNLAAFRYRGPEAILQNVLDPNCEVNPMYVSYIIRTSDERTISGMIESESSEIITLTRGADYRDSVNRSDIAEMKSSHVSVMPDGFEHQLDPQAMADLLAYLMQIR